MLKDSLGVDIVFMGSGSIRNEKLRPVVKYSDFSECYPYNDVLPKRGGRLIILK